MSALTLYQGGTAPELAFRVGLLPLDPIAESEGVGLSIVVENARRDSHWTHVPRLS